MINANFCNTITWYHLSKTESADTWSREVIPNCSFVSMIKESVTDTNKISVARMFTVRIPKKISITHGDIIVHGEVADTIGDNMTAPQLLQKYLDTSFQVRAVSDNTAYVIPHMKVVS